MTGIHLVLASSLILAAGISIQNMNCHNSDET